MRSLVAALIAAACLIACATYPEHRRAGVLEYLYPEGSALIPPSDVQLDLPLRVGVAFAPVGLERSGSDYGPPRVSTPANYSPTFDASAQQRLLDRVVAAFEGTPGVESIEILPSYMLRPGGGFENVDQLRRLLGLDVIALISYEQTQFNDYGVGSFTYLSIIGAYIVEANRNETHTFVDASVFDIPSRALLFNAGGRSLVESRSTEVQVDAQQREDSIEGFEVAIDGMVAELQTALAVFREQVASGTVRGAGTPGLAVTGGQGAGAAGALELGLALLLAVSGLLARRA
jgi:rhombotail lipoprotein